MATFTFHSIHSFIHSERAGERYKMKKQRGAIVGVQVKHDGDVVGW